MKLTTHIRNLIFLWRQRNKTEIPKNADAEVMLRVTKIAYKRKNSWVRNQVAQLIKKIRKVRPYKIKDYSEAKAKYDSIEPIDLSKVKEGSYVFKFSTYSPTKGERWCEYCIVYDGGAEGVYKVNKYNDRHNYFSLETYSGNWNHFTTLHEGSSRSFRFATEEEIEEFKNRQKEYKQKKKQIKLLEQQIQKLYKEL